MKDNSEAKWVAFTEIQMPGGAQWHITIREGCSPEDVDSAISAVEHAQGEFGKKDWEKPDWKKNGKVTAKPADPDPQWIQDADKNLGNCALCDAPNKLSKAGKPYCSAVCWKK